MIELSPWQSKAQLQPLSAIKEKAQLSQGHAGIPGSQGFSCRQWPPPSPSAAGSGASCYCGRNCSAPSAVTPHLSALFPVGVPSISSSYSSVM